MSSSRKCAGRLFQTCGLARHHSFISAMHHYECVAPGVDIILQSGRFWAMSIASFRERFNDSRSCWVVFIHVVWGRPCGLLQFSKGEAVKIICLAFDSSGIHAMWPHRDRRRAWTVIPDNVSRDVRNYCYSWLSTFRCFLSCLSVLEPRDVVALFSISHHHFIHGGTIWFPAAYTDISKENYQPALHGKYSVFRRVIVVSFHSTVHRGQLHLTLEVHCDETVFHRRIPEVLLRISQLSTTQPVNIHSLPTNYSKNNHSGLCVSK